MASIQKEIRITASDLLESLEMRCRKCGVGVTMSVKTFLARSTAPECPGGCQVLLGADVYQALLQLQKAGKNDSAQEIVFHVRIQDLTEKE